MHDPNDDYAALFDHTYLRWFDLAGQPAVVEIVKADRKVELTLPGGAKSRKPVIHLKQISGKIETMKPLVLNVTNASAIAGLHGRNVSGWIGKHVELFQTERQLRGELVPAIGVRAPAVAKKDVDWPEFSKRYEAALRECEVREQVQEAHLKATRYMRSNKAPKDVLELTTILTQTRYKGLTDADKVSD